MLRTWCTQCCDHMQQCKGCIPDSGEEQRWRASHTSRAHSCCGTADQQSICPVVWARWKVQLEGLKTCLLVNQGNNLWGEYCDHPFLYVDVHQHPPPKGKVYIKNKKFGCLLTTTLAMKNICICWSGMNQAASHSYLNYKVILKQGNFVTIGIE